MSDGNYMQDHTVHLEVHFHDIPLSKADGSGISFFIDLTTENEFKFKAISKKWHSYRQD